MNTRPSNIKLDGFPTEPLAILYFALRARIGILLRTPNREKARQELYAARTRCGDQELWRLEVRTAPEALGPGLVIVKTKGEKGK